MATWNVGDIVTRKIHPSSLIDWFIIESIDDGNYYCRVLKSERLKIGELIPFIRYRLNTQFTKIT